MFRRLPALSLTALLAVFVLHSGTFASSSSQVTAVGDVREHRVGHTATPLLDGKVLIAGGANESGALASAEVFDPATGAFSAIASMNSQRQWHTATRLPNGDVLIAGGSDTGGALDTAEVYDPSSGQFALIGPMAAARSEHSATLLSDGRVLIAGGDGAGTAELFEPSSQAFVPLVNHLTAIRAGHSASLLPDGLVFIAGGTDASGNAVDSVEAYDPTTQTFTALPYPMFSARSGLADAVTAAGDVLLVGGDATGSMELFRSAEETFTRLALSLGAPDATANRLANNKVLVVGRDGAAVFDPASGQLEGFDGSASLARQAHSAARLATDGKVLIGFGADAQGAYLSAASLFNPAQVRTDQDDYPPGTTVYIGGGGFLANETVQLQVLHVGWVDGEHVQDASDGGAALDTWTVQADANGNLVDATWYVCLDGCAGALLELTATGSTSGLTAETRFTDAAFALFEDSGRTIKRDAFAWGSTVYALLTQVRNDTCYRVQWIDPGSNAVETHDLPGTSGLNGNGNRNDSFLVPPAGPSGIWTARMSAYPNTNFNCTGSLTVQSTLTFDVGRAVIIGAGTAGADSVGGDNDVNQNQPTVVQGGGTAVTLSVASASGSKNERAFVRFDLTGSGISGTVTDAKLRLLMSASPNNSRSENAHR